MARIADSFREKCSYSPALMVSALVDSIPYPLIVRNSDFDIVLSNKAAQDYYAADLLGCKCYEAQGARDCLCESCPAVEAERTGKPVDREVRHPRTGDYLVISVYPMYDDEGRLCGIIETCRDVTQQRRSVDRIRRLLAQVNAKNQELTAWQQSFEYELKAAREIQMMLVPDQPVCVGKVCFDFLYRPSGEVGGDFHDVFALGPDQVGLIVSDASGHGVGAALVAVMLRMVFRSPGLDRRSPRRVLQTLNEELLRIVPAGQFATAFYGVFNTSERQLRFASAGHPLPLFVRHDGAEIETIGEGSLVLGTVEDLEFEERAVSFSPGDKLLVYTDGVPDAANRAGERFGLDRLAAGAEAQRDLHGREFLQRVVAGIEAYLAGKHAADDMTLVLAESVSVDKPENYWLGES